MIKIDIISGFLGVGKTTLIKRYLDSLSKSGEKVILIENDFGDIGIDKDLFTVGGLDIYEINKGCLCCSLKVTFIETLIEIAENIKPDRVIVEPSGLFILSEIFDLFRYSQINDNYKINSVVSIIDGIHFQKHKLAFGNFLVNQIENAGTLLISKTDMMDEPAILEVVNDLTDDYQDKEIIARDYQKLSDEEISAIFNKDTNSNLKISLPKNLNSRKRERNHLGFSSYSFHSEIPILPQTLKDKLQELDSGEYGEIIRAKGFIPQTELGKDYLEFHYVDGSIAIKNSSKQDIKGSLCFIGRNLNNESLISLFK